MTNDLISFNEQFFCGLFGFVRKLELSVHRAQSISELNNFLLLHEEEYSNVTQILSKRLIQKDKYQFKKFERASFLKKALGKYMYTNKLFESEIFYLVELLLSLKKILLRDFNTEKNSNEELRQIRLDLRYFYEEILGNRISEHKKEKLLSVEHLNQNIYIEHRSIIDIIGKWY